MTISNISEERIRTIPDKVALVCETLVREILKSRTPAAALEAGLALAHIRGQRESSAPAGLGAPTAAAGMSATSEQCYRLLFDSMIEGFALFETVSTTDTSAVDFRFLAINPALVRLLGRKRDAVLGRLLHEVLPELEVRWLEHFRQVAATGTAAFFEDYSQALQRHASVSVFCPTAGQLAVLIEDITERKRIEEERRASEERFRTLTALAPVGVFLANAQGHCQYVNDKWQEMSGLTASEAVGANWLTTVHPGDRERVSSHWQAAPAAHGATGLEYRLQKKPDGFNTWVYGIAAPLRAADGQLTGYIGIQLDITTRKEADQKRLASETQIQQAQKLESLGALAGGIAHDFNNLLMAILGNVDLSLRELPPQAPIRAYLSDAEKAARRAAELCRQMLAYSGKGRFVVERVNLTELINDMARMLEVSVSRKIVLRYQLAATLPPIEADVSQMQQIIMNLVINAAEAIGANGGFVTISTGAMECDHDMLNTTWLRQDLPAGTYVFIEIQDTGCGMTAEVQQRIFDPFFSTKFTGRGLGLAAVLGIVRGHKGSLKVASAPARGSTFRILLPALPAETVKLQIKDPVKKLWQGSGTILLVDDEEAVRTLSKQLLERLGFNCLTAANGREALTVFQAHGNEIVAILLDLSMPYMDGEQAFYHLQRLKPDVRVIMSSGYDLRNIADRFQGKGLAGFIHKPYELTMLADTLRTVLADNAPAPLLESVPGSTTGDTKT
jgi:PAS domain S-box-containing protein